jgi:predicted ATPase|tara:strand:+ start:185 stop:907 length:723 start_codon:yes stop_codon:yes gene_type:complete
MRIAFSGTGNSGKTTLVKSFLYTWKNYTTPEKTYREVLEEENLPHSSKTTTKTQEKILNFMIEQVQEADKDSNIIFDRCPLDNIAYSMWCNEKKVKGFTNSYVAKQIELMRESMRFLDIIFLCRFDESQVVEDDGFRDTDKEFIKEVDNIFQSLYLQYTQNPEADVFFPKGDSPCIIELPNKGQERIDLIAEYVTPDGNMYGDDSSIFSDIDELEKLVIQQKAAHDQEEKEKELYKRFGI